MTDLFKDKTEMPQSEKRAEGAGLGESRPGPDVVHTIQTPAQQRAVWMSNYPRYDWMDVKNLHRPRFGHGY